MGDALLKTPPRPSQVWPLVRDPLHFIALGFGAGLSRWAPGTMGSLLAWWMYPAFALALPQPLLVVWLLFATAIGGYLCGRAAAALGQDDPGAVVWDEMVAVWWLLWLVPAGLVWEGAAVALFRLFDIAKPWPIPVLEERLAGGWGIMVDDLAAAALAAFVLAVAKYYLG